MSPQINWNYMRHKIDYFYLDGSTSLFLIIFKVDFVYVYPYYVL